MVPLEHIMTGVYNTAVERWARRGRISTATTIGPLLRKAACIMLQGRTLTSIARIPRVENIELDAASILTHLTVPAFIKYFNTTLLKPTPYSLSLLISGVTLKLHKMLLTKQSLMASPITEPTRIICRGKNWTPSAHGCAYQHTYKVSATQSPS